MAVSSTNHGTPIEITRGGAATGSDFYPARITGDVIVAYNNGRPQMLAPIVALQVNRAGEEFLKSDLYDLIRAFDRTQRCIALDGTAAEPKTVQELMKDAADAARTFLQSRPAESAPVAVSTLVD